VLSIPSTTYKDSNGDVRSTGIIDLWVLDDMLSGRWSFGRELLDPESICMICITHIPTNSGIINPVNDIGQLIQEHNKKWVDEKSFIPKCFYLVDACQSAGQIQLDVQRMRCHALTATGRKNLRGPRGTGFLYVQKDVANALEPSHIDHSSSPVKGLPDLALNEGVATTASASLSPHLGTIDLTEKIFYSHKKGASRFEFWESNIAGKLGLGAAVDYAVNGLGMNNIETKTCALGDKLRSRLREMEQVQVYHDYDSGRQCGIVVFSVDGFDPAQVKEALLKPSSMNESTQVFEVSVVPATSTPVDSAKSSTADLVRASLSYFNTEKEIDLFCAKIGDIIKGLS
jgi:cysteine desulfurase/selenocysteine lyase